MATSTIGTGQTYTTVKAWEAAKQGDFVTATEGQRGEMLAETFDEDQLQFSGSTTDATYKWTLTCASGAEHGGVAGDGAILYSNYTGSSWNTITIVDDYMEVLDIEVIADHSNIRCIGSSTGSDGHIDIKRVLGHGGGTIDPSYCYNFNAGTGTVTVESCCGYNTQRGCYGKTDTTKVTVLHCTFVEEQTDDSESGKPGCWLVTAKNTVCFHFGGLSGWADFNSINAGSTKCAADDATGTESGLDNLTPENELTDLTDYAMDLHIAPGGTGTLIGAGATGLGVSTDLAGNSFNTPPSIGCFELVAAGGATYAGYVQSKGGWW